jgi:hypothetical protein
MTGVCRYNGITNLTMGDIEDLGSAILYRVDHRIAYLR